jgi:choline-glycine betaine transporter
MGFLRDATGSFHWGFYSIALFAAVGLILAIILQRVRHKASATLSSITPNS